jgi:hypothetical protein
MSNKIIYSVLQYKYSPILNEAVNIGVLFCFLDEEKKLYFVDSGTSRVKALYGDIDSKYFDAILKLIKTKSEDKAINETASTISDFEYFIDHYILKKDDSVFQFSKPYSVSNIYNDPNAAIKNFEEILLPTAKNKKVKESAFA